MDFDFSWIFAYFMVLLVIALVVVVAGILCLATGTRPGGLHRLVGYWLLPFCYICLVDAVAFLNNVYLWYLVLPSFSLGITLYAEYSFRKRFDHHGSAGSYSCL